MDEIYGVSLDQLAEFGGKYSEFQAKHSEADARAAFDQWLRSQGTDSNQYWLAYQAWQERFRADPTGQLYASFTMKCAEIAQRVHMGDVRNMSEDTQEGVTLDRYAQLAVAMSKPGIDPEAVAREHGLTDAAHWVRVNSAWSTAMSQDLEHKLTTQFGVLYQKYAGPAFAEQQFQATAAILAESNQPQDKIDEPVTPDTPDTLLQKLASPSRNERWRAAYLLAHAIDIGAAKGPSYRAACIPVLIDILEHHDEHTVSDAESAARRLLDIGERTADVKGSMARCLARAEEKLVSLKAAFEPIRDQAVPERVALNSRIQSYGSLVSTLQGYLADFQESAAPAAVPAAFVPTERAGSAPGTTQNGGGFRFVLPLAAVGVVAVGGLVALLLLTKKPADVSLNAATTAAESATLPAPIASAVTEATPAAAAPSAPAEASAQPAATGAPAKHVHAGKPHHTKKKP